MKSVPAYEAKSKFAEYLRAVAGGESFVITRNGQRMAELRPCQGPEIRRRRGMLRMKFGPLGGEFHEPLDEFGASS
jgi:prevent-host-death family protein